MVAKAEDVVVSKAGLVESKESDSSQNNLAFQFHQTQVDKKSGIELNDTKQQSDNADSTASGDIFANSEDIANQIDLLDESEGVIGVSIDERLDQEEITQNSLQEVSTSEDDLETTGTADQSAPNFKARIDIDASRGSQLPDDAAVESVMTDEIHSEIQPALDKLAPDATVSNISPPPETFDSRDHYFSTDASSSIELSGCEILFDGDINNAVFSDGSADIHLTCNEKWRTNQHRFAGVLTFTSPVMRVLPARYFWSTSVYESRILAVYTNPDMIMILRRPKNIDEVHRLNAIRGQPGSSIQEINDFLVAENVIDPKTCKLRLSQLTNPTSLPLQDASNNEPLPLHRISNMNKIDNRKHTYFDIVTPTETVHLTAAAFLPSDSSEDLSLKSLHYTHRCEFAIASTIMKVHFSNFALGGDDDQAWKHQVILGTPHSYVISGNDQLLKESLRSALAFHNARNPSEPNKIDSFIIDAKDENGKTALHYACSRRKVSTVRLLVEAGADCSVPQNIDELTPCHICANGLDEKILSIVLSARHPTRPDPNVLDCHGRTPMYLAAVEGRCVDGRRSSEALDLCLSALEAWGGVFIADSPNGIALLHPVHFASAQWKYEELSVILSHCKYRYPLVTSGSDSGCSVSAQFQYPIHAAIASLRNQKCTECMPIESTLVKTLQTLLDHGFEPNERIEGIQGEAIKILSRFIGFTPLQVLTVIAAETRSTIDLQLNQIGENIEVTRILKNVNNIIQASAELLMMNGARVNMPSPPSHRLHRQTPLDDPTAASSRECFPLDKNQIVALIGGSSRENSSIKAFTNNSLKIFCAFEIGSTSYDSNAPGGSDSTSCAICWSEFGVVSNRKHLCRASRKFVCHECSTKRVIVNGSEHRISDGQYLLALSDAKKLEKKAKVDQETRMNNHRQSATQSRKSLGLEPKARETINSTAETAEPTLKDKFANAFSGLGQAKDAVLERGAKLESLAEKTESLEQASIDFANLAKELNRSQNSWW